MNSQLCEFSKAIAEAIALLCTPHLKTRNAFLITNRQLGKIKQMNQATDKNVAMRYTLF